METNSLGEIRDIAMEIVIDQRLSGRRSNGRTEQEATDDVIIYLSGLGQDIFQAGVDILRRRGMIAENMNIYFAGWRLVVIGPADSGQGVTTVLTRQEMELLPFGSRWVVPNTFLDFNGRQLVSVDDETDQSDMTWNIVNFSDGTRPRRVHTGAIISLPRQMVSDTLSQGEEADCSICRNELEDDATVIVLSCRHWFCCECIISWLNANNTCPMCRREVFDDL